jgi:hypothetical protein
MHLHCVCFTVTARIVASIVLNDAVEKVTPVCHLHNEIPDQALAFSTQKAADDWSAQILVGTVEVQEADDVFVADLRPDLDLVFTFNRGCLQSKNKRRM